MKRILMTLLVLVITMSANAQWKEGELTKPITDKYGCNFTLDGGCFAFKEIGGGKVTILVGFRDDWSKMGTYPANCIKETGWFWGEITDPRDNYVNVRKGPGTEYAVIKTLLIGESVTYKKTNNNWWQVEIFDRDGNFTIGYVYYNRIKSLSSSKFIPLKTFIDGYWN